MINILSLNCSLAFAPYLRESIEEYLDSGSVSPRVVRQAGSGLILRSDGDLVLRYQGRESWLDPQASKHYLATIEVRAVAHDVRRLTDEVVISNLDDSTFLSHPQSDLWLDRETTTTLVQMFTRPETHVNNLPEWLSASVAAGDLLLSDQRNGRWVLLGADHVDELKRRASEPATRETRIPTEHPPTISVKGLAIRLQSALQLAKTLEDFADNDELTQYEEVSPRYSFSVSRCTEGIELRDTNNRAAMTRREARKWADVINAEIEQLNLFQIERGRIRTVFANTIEGRWVLQWGDEVLCPHDGLESPTSRPLTRDCGEFRVLLDLRTSSCVALTESEAGVLRDSR